MSVTLMRVTTNHDGNGDYSADPFIFDLIVDKERDVVQNFPTSGWWGSFASRSAELLPFILSPKGKLDFGSGYENDDRYGTSNILTKKVILGEYITVNVEQQEYCMKIVKLDVLAP